MPFNPYSWTTYPGDGTTNFFVAPFPYAKREHVRVLIGWDPSTRSFASELLHDSGFVWANGTSITTATAPAAGTTISLVRETPIDEQLTQWQTGSPPTAFELETADRQVLYALQEFVDRTLQTREDLDEAVFEGAGVTLIDNLSSSLTTAALTANQGRALRLLVEGVAAAANAAAGGADAAQADADAAQADADAAAQAAAEAQSTADGRSRLALGAVVSVSGSAVVDFTGIPSWAKKVHVMLNGVSTNGTSLVYLQLGTAGGVQNSGYFSNASVISPLATAAGSDTAGIQVGGNTADASRTGIVTLALMNSDANAWAHAGVTADSGSTGTVHLAGIVALIGALTRLRLVTGNGTDLFDGGQVNIQYEG